MSRDGHTVEGIARVVKIDGGVAWFEPEQTTSCGHCASSGSCFGSASTGVGSLARRVELRRFPLADAGGLSVGDRVVVGVEDRALLKASATAYAIPLLAALALGAAAQSLYGDDLITLLTMVGGLFAGLAMSAVAARRLAARGELSPRFLRRAAPGETCSTN